jgi:protein-L-isoaspartate(D-aspartate) O-methyltransferase
MNYRLSLGDGYSGWLEYAPYDAIVVTACATHVPESLLNQLNPETGRLVIPVLKQAGEPEGEQELWCYYHVPGKQTIKREFHGKVRFVPMLPGVP